MEPDKRAPNRFVAAAIMRCYDSADARWGCGNETSPDPSETDHVDRLAQFRQIIGCRAVVGPGASGATVMEFAHIQVYG